MKKIVSTDKAPASIGPYAQANLAGGMLFISGQIAIDPATGKILDGVKVETHQVMRNLKAILAAEGLTFKDVVKASIFLKNIEDFAEVNEIYASYLDPEGYPARETMQVACLPKDVSVEISMIAYKGL